MNAAKQAVITSLVLQAAAVLSTGICGCSNTQDREPRVSSSLDIHIGKRADGATWVEIAEAGRTVFEAKLSDSDICAASLSEVSPIDQGQIDFDSDGTPEVVVDMWDGGNRFDTVFVFGKRKGSWSQWDGILTPFEYELCDVDKDGHLDFVLPPKYGAERQVLYFRNGRFVP